VLTGSPLEVVTLLVAPPMAVIALALSSRLRDPVLARRVLAIIAVLSLFEIALLSVVLNTLTAP
jgi:hypothetical protein